MLGLLWLLVIGLSDCPKDCHKIRKVKVKENPQYIVFYWSIVGKEKFER